MKILSLNFLGMILVTLALLFGLSTSLKYITNHNQKISVPNIIGEDLQDGIRVLSSNKMGYILVDSMFDVNLRPHEIIDQSPKEGSYVKQKRKIYLTINSINPPSVILPNLIDMSKRQAILVLESSGFKLGREIYQPDIAKDAVLQARVNGSPTEPDMLLPKGSVIDLVLGDGLGSLDVEIPDLIGLTVMEAMAVLDAINLTVGQIINDKGGDVDDLGAYVYYQQPEFGSSVKLSPGDPVNIYIANVVPENLFR